MKTTFQRIAMILFMTGFIFSARAQEMEVTGTVYDAQDKSPIVGATVTVKGSNNGTVTDVNGKYRIKAEKGETLVFSFIGYLQQEKKVKKSQLDVYLKPDLQTLEEVVVVAFGTQKKTSIVGSVTRQAEMRVMPPMRPPFVVREDNSEEYSMVPQSHVSTKYKESLPW